MGLLLANGRLLVDGSITGTLALRIEGDRIARIGARDAIALPGDQVVDLSGQILAPGFIDVQVNGGGGRMFNDAPTIETIEAMVAAHRVFGTTAMLPTLITSNLDVMSRAADSINQALADGMPGVLGIHFEGPLLNPARKGVHDCGLFLRSEERVADILTSIEHGRVLVTLAPERVGNDLIAHLAAHGVTVSLGHTDCDFGEARAAFGAGARFVTHLFNAMPPMLAREPGPIAAALLDPRVFCGLIVDGHHVDPASLTVALRAMGNDRAVLVTDAMADVGPDLSDFDLGGTRVFHAGGRLATAGGTLAGSALSMIDAVRNAVAMLGVPLAAALRMASANPAALLGLSNRVGSLREGMSADLVMVDDRYSVRSTVVAGRIFESGAGGSS